MRGPRSQAASTQVRPSCFELAGVHGRSLAQTRPAAVAHGSQTQPVVRCAAHLAPPSRSRLLPRVLARHGYGKLLRRVRRLAAWRKPWIGACASITVSCGSSFPVVPSNPAPAAYLEVPYPPPAARVEMVPPKPSRAALWLDGGWSWLGRGWVWIGGGWVSPTPGTYYSRWAVVRAPDGRLYFAPGEWRDALDRVVAPPLMLIPAGTQGSTQSQSSQ